MCSLEVSDLCINNGLASETPRYWVRIINHKMSRVTFYDGQGFWTCYKRMSQSRFRFWPSSPGGVAKTLLAHELQVLIFGGDPLQAQGAPVWRPVSPMEGESKDPGAYVP